MPKIFSVRCFTPRKELRNGREEFSIRVYEFRIRSRFSLRLFLISSEMIEIGKEGCGEGEEERKNRKSLKSSSSPSLCFLFFFFVFFKLNA